VNQPSEGELKLLKPLWRAPRLSAREVHDASAPETGWSYSTTRTTLDRMLAKGIVRAKSVHGMKTYSAAHSKVGVMAGLIRSLSRDVLGLEGPLPVAAFASSKHLSAKELEALEALLEKLDRESSGEAG